MARRGNYGFEKRQKEIKRKQKAEAKLDRRRAQRDAANQPLAPDDPASRDAGPPAIPERESSGGDSNVERG